MTDDNKDKIDILFNLFSSSYMYFYVWKGLQKEEYNEYFAKNNFFWNSTLHSLQLSWLNNLSNIFENSNYSKTGLVVSAYLLKEEQKDLDRKKEAEKILNKHSSLIISLKKLRGNQLSHNNIGHLSNPQIILKKFPIKYKDVEELLEDAPKLLSSLHPSLGHSYAFSNFKESCKKSSEHLMSQIKYYSDKEKEHIEKLKDGEIDNWEFPPETKN